MILMLILKFSGKRIIVLRKMLRRGKRAGAKPRQLIFQRPEEFREG